LVGKLEGDDAATVGCPVGGADGCWVGELNRAPVESREGDHERCLVG
jgi:hypothetical protein